MPEYVATINLVARDQTGPTIQQVSSKLSGLGEVASGAMGAVGKSVAGVVSSMATASAAGVTALTAFGVGAFGAAARVGELDATLRALAKTNGVSYDSLNQAALGVRSMGIEYASAQQLVAQFTQNQLDTSKAQDLARVAQDAAVISQQNSTDTLDSLVHGILTQNTMVLRNAGINIDATKAQADYAKQLGITTKQMTSAQKQAAVLNAVLDAGASIAGTYESAMEEPGKVLRSFPRLFNDISVAVGQNLLTAFGPVILQLYNLTKAFSLAVTEGGVLQPIFDAVGAAASAIAAPLGTVTARLTAWLKNLDRAQVQGFLDTLGRFAPILAPLGAALVTLGGANILGALGPLGAVFGALGISINPVAVAIAALVLAVPPLRDAAGQLAIALWPLVQQALPAMVQGADLAMQGLYGLFEIVGNLATAIANLVGWFRQHAAATGALIGTVTFLSTLYVLLNVGTWAAAAGAGALAIAQGVAAAATGALSVATGILNAVMAANPIFLVIAALAALIAILVFAYNNSETFRNAVNAAWATLQQFGATAWEVGSALIEGIGNVIQTVAGWVQTNSQAILTAILLLIPGIGTVAAAWINNWGDIQGKVQAVVAFIQTIPGIVQDALSRAGQFFSDLGSKIQGLLGPLGNVASAISNLFRFGTTPPIGGGTVGEYAAFQEGGWLREPIAGIGLSSGRGYKLAEAGPEYVMPAGGGVPGGVGGGMTISGPITVTVNGAAGPADTWANAADMIFDELYARVSRGLANRPLGAGRGAY